MMFFQGKNDRIKDEIEKTMPAMMRGDKSLLVGGGRTIYTRKGRCRPTSTTMSNDTSSSSSAARAKDRAAAGREGVGREGVGGIVAG
jgi:hypothetical protein